MPRHRRVYFEDEVQHDINIRHTRGGSSARDRSADRVHTVYDDLTADMPGRERVVAWEAYDQLLRENQYLRIQVRELEDAQAWPAQLQQQNAELRRENRELRRAAADPAAEAEARKESAKLRKKCTKLEAELADLASQLAEWKAQATEWHGLYESLWKSHGKIQAELRKTENDKEMTARLAGVYRQNLGAFEEAKRRLEKENARLKRDRNLDDLHRRRPF